MATDWIAALDGVDHRLRHGAEADVADVACGQGWSAIGLARVYPAVRILGWDRDDGDIAVARRNASDADLGRRVVFEVTPPSVAPGHVGRYDLVTAATPLDRGPEAVAMLRLARALVAARGAVVMVHAGPLESLIDSARTGGFAAVTPLAVAHDVFGVYLLRR